jgi:hypothetical protein
MRTTKPDIAHCALSRARPGHLCRTASVRAGNGEFAFERELTIQPFGLIRPDGINSQGIGITYPSVEIDGAECVSPHQLQSVFVAIEDCASALRGQQLRRSAHDRVSHLFIRRDLQSSVRVVHKHLAPYRIDPRRSLAFICGSNNELVRQLRFYADDEIGPLGINGELHGLLLRAGAIPSRFGGLTRFIALPRNDQPCGNDGPSRFPPAMSGVRTTSANNFGRCLVRVCRHPAFRSPKEMENWRHSVSRVQPHIPRWRDTACRPKVLLPLRWQHHRLSTEVSRWLLR